MGILDAAVVALAPSVFKSKPQYVLKGKCKMINRNNTRSVTGCFISDFQKMEKRKKKKSVKLRFISFHEFFGLDFFKTSCPL